MSQIIKQQRRYSAMEADTISKNEASPKSLMSRRNFKIFTILACVLSAFVLTECYYIEDEIDYSKFEIVNNGNGAVKQITDPSDKEPLAIVQTIPSSYSSFYASSKSAKLMQRYEANKSTITTRVAQTQNIGTFPANLPVIFFFNDKILLGSIENNFEVIVDGESIKGTISINEGANGYAILTFIPWKEFDVNKNIAVTVKKGIQDDGGNTMLNDVNILYTTSSVLNTDFSNNNGFEEGNTGVKFVGDGAVINGKSPLLAKEGNKLAAISSGTRLVSEYGDAIGGASSMMTLTVNKAVYSIKFDYDFISAEFNEWVDKAYDDCAMVIVSGPKGSYAEFITSVNTIRYNNTKFSGFPNMPDEGDDYAGHTGWTTHTLKFPNVGSPVFITFTVTDVADLILSSILAIDNIQF